MQMTCTDSMDNEKMEVS